MWGDEVGMRLIGMVLDADDNLFVFLLLYPVTVLADQRRLYKLRRTTYACESVPASRYHGRFLVKALLRSSIIIKTGWKSSYRNRWKVHSLSY